MSINLKALLGAAASALIYVLMAIALAVALLMFTGCAGRFLTPVYAPQPPGSTNAPVLVGYVPNTNVVGTAGTIGQVGQVLPPPGNWLVTGLAALFTAGIGVYAKMKTNQATKAQDILNAVITGVEAVGASAKPVKQSIATHVAATGHGAELDKSVQAVSDKM